MPESTLDPPAPAAGNATDVPQTPTKPPKTSDPSVHNTATLQPSDGSIKTPDTEKKVELNHAKAVVHAIIMQTASSAKKQQRLTDMFERR